MHDVAKSPIDVDPCKPKAARTSPKPRFGATSQDLVPNLKTLCDILALGAVSISVQHVRTWCKSSGLDATYQDSVHKFRRRCNTFRCNKKGLGDKFEDMVQDFRVRCNFHISVHHLKTRCTCSRLGAKCQERGFDATCQDSVQQDSAKSKVRKSKYQAELSESNLNLLEPSATKPNPTLSDLYIYM